MQFAALGRILGMLLMLVSLTHLPPLLLALYDGSDTRGFALALTVTLATGLGIWLPLRRRQGELRSRDGGLLAALFWLVRAVFGAMPFDFAAQPQLGRTDPLFEAVSGLSASG